MQTHRRTRSAITGRGGNGCIPGFGCIMPRSGAVGKIGDSRWRKKSKENKNATIACTSISLGREINGGGNDNNKPANQHQFLLFPSTYEPTAAKCQQQMHKQPESLTEQLEQCVRQGQVAISDLELLRARQNVLAEIQADFEYYGEETTEDVVEEEADSEMVRTNFVDKFVHQVKTLYDLARRIEMLVPSLLEVLCSGCNDTIAVDEDDEDVQRYNLLREQMLSKNFAKLLDMAIRFDTLKAATPALQNGFSLYRRLSLTHCFGEQHQRVLYSGDQMAMFLSRPAPLLISAVNGAERYIGKQPNRQLAISHLAEALLVIYNVLKYTLERRHQLNLSPESTQAENPVGDFLLRAMVGILLLFDHVDQNAGGVFCCTGGNGNSCLFDVTEFVTLARRENGTNNNDKGKSAQMTTDKNNNSTTVQQHLACLRFMSRHFNDAETPAHVRRMFA